MIKNIIFDLGNVIFNLNYNLTAQAFKNLGAKNFDESYSWSQEYDLFKLFEVGKITTSYFREHLKKILHLENITDAEFDCAWNAMLVGLPKENLTLLKSLRQQYELYLFSNTNAIHLPQVFNICRRDTGHENLSGFFDKEYYSHIFGYRKPDGESFNKILEENGLKSKETFFVDDHLPHILGAKAVGIDTLHLVDGTTIFDLPNIIAQRNS